MSKGQLPVFLPFEQAAKAFDHTLVSGDLGMKKPDTKIFLYAAEIAQVPPEACLMIDDTMGNCTGARAVGFRTLRYLI